MNASEVDARVQNEIDCATEKYGAFASAHEGYGVLAEEMSELLDAIRSNTDVVVQIEACQVAAVAWHLAASLTDENEATLKRSGMR